MANQSYCRFQNTWIDLADCSENLPYQDLSFEEALAFRKLVKICREIAQQYEGMDDQELWDEAYEN